MEKNPFSLFDFLGYFIPGAFAIFLVCFLQNNEGILFYLKLENIKTLNNTISIPYITFFIILSYILGHVLSFLSTLTIENFTVWMFGYPSKNLLGIPKVVKYFEKKKKNNTFNWGLTLLSFLLRFLLFIFLIPISISSVSIGNILNLNNSVYKKELGEPYVRFIKAKIEDIFKKHDIYYRMDFINDDYNKLLIHHSYNINIPHQSKLMNYVALYGFLRVISFIFNLLSVFLILKLLFLEEINLKIELIIMLISFFLTYITYLGYLKFYRRYSQENLMILLL
ncbi:hypothetical protein [Flavobacterium gillisiae]|nr:hypothetical protein [Flavobacterium gillisiae]